MKNYKEMNWEERKDIAKLFANWLKNYTDTVIIRVMEQRDEIINNEFAMNLLKELLKREEAEYHDFSHSIGSLLSDFETFKEFDPHSHPTTHAKSYRDILYDMYIKK